MTPTVFVHIVTYNHADTIAPTIEALLKSSGVTLKVAVRDNHSSDNTLLILQKYERESAIVSQKVNLGFAAAHNAGVAQFLKSDAQFFLCLNPDLVLDPSAIQELVAALLSNKGIGLASPKLLRTDSTMQRVNPTRLDAAGMYITPALRHFDRGSGEQDLGHHDTPCLAFGGTGACLLLNRECIESLGLRGRKFDSDLERVYPELGGGEERYPLYDEAFFAYREDADLSWRAQLMGWSCIYWPKAIGYHRRVVVPERRAELTPELNRLGVRNRFLLQLNNFSLDAPLDVWIRGVIFRNLIVLFGVLIKEHSSLSALSDLLKLTRRALERRRTILSRRRRKNAWRWFRAEPYSEPISSAL